MCVNRKCRVFTVQERGKLSQGKEGVQVDNVVLFLHHSDVPYYFN